MPVYLLFAMRLGWKLGLAQKALESHCELILKGRKFFSSPILSNPVSGAFAFVTKYASMGLRPSMAQKSDM